MESCCDLLRHRLLLPRKKRRIEQQGPVADCDMN